MLAVPSESSFDSREQRDAILRSLAGWNLDARTDTYISCWTIAQRESAPIWAAYTEQSNGIAIRSTVGRLQTAFSRTPERIHVGKINYTQPESTDPKLAGNVLTPFFMKRPEFRQENELRAIVMSKSVPDSEFGMPEWDPNVSHKGVAVPVDLNALIQEVVLAPQCWNTWHDAITSLLKTHRVRCKCRRSVIDESHSFEQHLERLQEHRATRDAFRTVTEWLWNSFFDDCDKQKLALLVQLCGQVIRCEQDVRPKVEIENLKQEALDLLHKLKETE